MKAPMEDREDSTQVVLYWQEKTTENRLYSLYCWLQEQCWSITFTQDTSSPHILADWTTQCKSHYLFTHSAPCMRTRQLKTTGRRRQETDNKYVDLCGSYGITIEGMRRQQTEKTTCGSDEQSKVMTSFFFFFFWFSCEHQANSLWTEIPVYQTVLWQEVTKN